MNIEHFTVDEVLIITVKGQLWCSDMNIEHFTVDEVLIITVSVHYQGQGSMSRSNFAEGAVLLTTESHYG